MRNTTPRLFCLKYGACNGGWEFAKHYDRMDEVYDALLAGRAGWESLEYAVWVLAQDIVHPMELFGRYRKSSSKMLRIMFNYLYKRYPDDPMVSRLYRVVGDTGDLATLTDQSFMHDLYEYKHDTENLKEDLPGMSGGLSRALICEDLYRGDAMTVSIKLSVYIERVARYKAIAKGLIREDSTYSPYNGELKELLEALGELGNPFHSFPRRLWHRLKTWRKTKGEMK